MKEAKKRENEMKECNWYFNDDMDYSYWSTECQGSFVIIEGSPKDNEYRYCPSCGGRLIMNYPPEDDREEIDKHH